LLSNEGGGELKGQHRATLIAKLSAVHAGGEFGCETGERVSEIKFADPK